MDLRAGTYGVDSPRIEDVLIPQAEVPFIKWDEIYSPQLKQEEDVLHVSSVFSWKLIDSYAAKIIDCNEKSVILDVVIDKENSFTQERIFKRSFFSNEIDIEVGTFLKLNVYERPDAQMIRVSEGLHVSDDDFPKVNLAKFSKKSLFE